jgi:carboxypeptidase Taq
MQTNYNLLKERLRKIADINYASALLQWDQEVYMPEKGAEIRAQQLATLAGISHEEITSAELGQLLNSLIDDAGLTEKELRNVKEALRNYKDRIKYPTSFVIEMSSTVSAAFNAWHAAKTGNDFSLFAPHLQKLVDLKLKECELLGYDAHPYDALINQHEPGCSTAELIAVFEQVKNRLVPFVKQVLANTQPDDSFTRLKYPKDKQWEFGLDVLRNMGYDFTAGRQDISSHPFTINFNSRDVRVTTRINENDLCEMIWSCIHEGGHALYEQGLPFDDYGLPSGEYLSLGIHESQSRLWENNVGRSFEFWSFHYKQLQETFPEQLKGIAQEEFYKAINKVAPSLIRTNADELTYHLHVLIRFEIEVGLMEGNIKVSELPAVWNAKYKAYLGIDVPDDARGVLQDVHWSHGSFGYFPTYSLGSFYAAQFYHAALNEHPEIKSEIKAGKMAGLLQWLRENIHIHGRQFTSQELCRRITGKELDFNEFMTYAEQKFGNGS